jgi:hypothetical protein
MNMKGFLRISAACSASLFIFSVYAKAAGEPVPPTIKASVPALAVKLTEKIQAPATSYMKAPDSEEAAIGHIDFDDFSNINDPLYREGSKVLLEKAIKADNAPKVQVKKTPVKKNLFRDAPADIPAKTAQPATVKSVNENRSPVFPVKKDRLIKLIPADPVENKSIL